ncbi:hypothetical protein MJH12_11025, partial [bacterium]|nr:hypothetical protein [bacterium]
MKNLLIKWTVLQLMTVCFSVITLADNNPNTDDLITSTQQLNITSEVVSVETSIQSSTNFSYISLSVGADKITTAFDRFLNHPANSGLSVEFLKQFDKKSLKSLQRYLNGTGASKQLWEKLETLGASMKELDEARLGLLDSDIKDKYYSLKTSAKKLQDAVTQAESSSSGEDAKIELDSIRKMALDAQRKRDEFFQAELEKLKLTLFKIEEEFGVNWFGKNYDDWFHLLSEVKDNLTLRQNILEKTDITKVSVKHENGKTYKVSLFRELKSRLLYVQRYAARAHRDDNTKIDGKVHSKQALKFGSSLVISWLFTRENVALALAGKADDTDTKPSNPSGWTEQSAKLYVVFAKSLNESKEFNLSVGPLVKQTLVGMVTKFNTMMAKVKIAKMEGLLSGILKDNIKDKFLKDKRVSGEALNEIQKLNTVYNNYLQTMDGAKLKKEAHLIELNKLLKKYGVTNFDVNKWTDIKQSKPMIEIFVKAGASATDVQYFIKNLMGYT